MNLDHNSPFRLSHIGFLSGATKRFVVNAPRGKTFQVYKYQYEDDKFHFDRVYEGTLSSQASELPGQWTGELSAVREPGNYRIHCGDEQKSRWFPVHDSVYEVPARVLFTFFTWQRCGHRLGWAGPCHLDDGIIKETGEHKDFSGGHHQSCDLRKSIDGVTLGLAGLVRYALLQQPHWDDGSIADEIKWGCEYFRKLVHPEGFMYDCLFESQELTLPAWWRGRFYRNRPAPPSEQWHSIELQALAAQYFREQGDKDYAARCLEPALRVWRYMLSEKRDPAAYHPPETPPLGLAQIARFYVQVYKDSAADLALRLGAGAALYRATGEREFLENVAACAGKLARLQLSDEAIPSNPAAACFREAEGRRSLAGNACSYAWAPSGELSLAEALELMPEHPEASRWKQCVERVAQQYALIASRNVWQRTPNYWVSEEELSSLRWGVRKENLIPCGHLPGEGRAQPCYYDYNSGNTFIICQALFLIRAARILGESYYLAMAQRQADWILGANPHDASCVTGVGYNQLPIPMWALTPPIPQIPGGTTVTLDRPEYDIPAAGQFMRLLAELSTR